MLKNQHNNYHNRPYSDLAYLIPVECATNWRIDKRGPGNTQGLFNDGALTVRIQPQENQVS